MALNTREKLFADEYIINKGNAYQAALKAGYSNKTAQIAWQWLKEKSLEKSCSNTKFKPELKQYIEAELDRIHSEKSADAKEVMEFLTSMMRGEETEQILKLVGDGVQTIDDIDVSAKERLKAAELIGKMLGVFTDKVNIKGAIPVVISGGDELED